MTRTYDCADRDELLLGMRMARSALARGEVIVMPTDTVYGVAVDAFSPEAVGRLLAAKGRSRQSPPPVLVADVATVRALAEQVPDDVAALFERFAPGPLTVILPAQPSLRWDLGETRGTVGLRIPAQDVALELLREVGPLAVSSANRHGEPPAPTAAAAVESLGDAIELALEAGPLTGAPSTIVDATPLCVAEPGPARIVRRGALGIDAIREVLGDRVVDAADG